MLHWTNVKRIITNVFYYGHFVYGGDIYEGKHEPIITKRLFDQVQAVIERRSNKTGTKPKTEKPFCGLLHCACCGMSITAETKTKTQKNGNFHAWTYYRCSKKHKTIKCSELPVRSEILDNQLSALLPDYSLPKAWGDFLLKDFAER